MTVSSPSPARSRLAPWKGWRTLDVARLRDGRVVGEWACCPCAKPKLWLCKRLDPSRHVLVSRRFGLEGAVAIDRMHYNVLREAERDGWGGGVIIRLVGRGQYYAPFTLWKRFGIPINYGDGHQVALPLTAWPWFDPRRHNCTSS